MENSTAASQNLLLKQENDSIELACATVLPLIPQYFQGIDSTTTVIIIITIILCLATFVIFAQNVRNIISNVPKKLKTKSILVCQIYPIVTGSAVVSILIPKSYFLCDTLAHICFTYCAYIFFSLCIDYADGEENFIKITDSQTFTIKTPPFCCCVPCFSGSAVTKKKILNIRYMVLQLPVVQSFIWILLNVLFLEDDEYFKTLILYFVPFIFTSIMIAIWGLNIIVRMIAPFFSDFKLIGKMLALQAVLLLLRVQPLVIMVIVNNFATSCDFPLTLQVQKNAIVQMLLSVEMFLLSCWALQLYKIPNRKK